MIDDDVGQVLKAAGPREKPPLEIERLVHERVRVEWRAVVDERRHDRRRRRAFALAAAGLAAAIGLWMTAPELVGRADAVATMSLAAGEVRASSGWRDRWRSVATGEQLVQGQRLRTGAASRGALAFAGGTSVRMDHDTRLTIAASDRILLERGALYVDSGPEARAAGGLAVVTTRGLVRHVGTQYEVRVLDAAVRIRVREGRVEWQPQSGASEPGHGGEQLTIAGDGRVDREPAPVFGDSWNWVGTATPGIDIEGLPLTEFLAWVARETGRTIAYESPAVETEIAAIVVHGSIAGLTPAQALDAVLATTRVSAAVVGGAILVAQPAAEIPPEA